MSTSIVCICTVFLIVYWIILLLIFERDKKYEVVNLNEEKLFDKYNPLLAGCFQGERDVLPRDILAVILNLIDKKCIKLEIEPSKENNETYDYYISRVHDKENELDIIEEKIYRWVFARCNR